MVMILKFQGSRLLVYSDNLSYLLLKHESQFQSFGNCLKL